VSEIYAQPEKKFGDVRLVPNLLMEKADM